MTPEDARQVLKEALLHVDFINLGRSISALGEHNYTWITFDNSKWRPDHHIAFKDAKWLSSNADKIFEAFTVLKDVR
jgi:hypothetical protein